MDDRLKALIEKANAAYKAGKYRDAARDFGSAAEAYAGSGSDSLAAEMKNNQSVALLQARQPGEALEVALGTEKVFAKTGDLRRQGMALANQAAALDALRRKDEALARYRRALTVFEKAGENEYAADVWKALAAIQASRGKVTDAVISMQTSLMGVEHPTLKQRILKKLLFLRLWR
ncbi:MAG: hypothetical protein FJZ96_09905 [Chloroflexi bacterium]|nr:hypothetical protein [Chloroflexota bacterium]